MWPDPLVFEELESTQDQLRILSSSGAVEGTSVMCLKQTHGRGRLGRLWVSPSAANLALSLLLRPHLSPSDTAVLGLAVSISIANVLRDLGINSVGLKWPNDIFVGSRKIAGILPEASISGNSVESLIIGIGLNVNSEIADFPPDLHNKITSIRIETHSFYSLPAIARSVLDSVNSLYNRIGSEGIHFVTNIWKSEWMHYGKDVMVNGIVFTAHDIGPDGSLILKDGDGNVTPLFSGEAHPLDYVQ